MWKSYVPIINIICRRCKSNYVEPIAQDEILFRICSKPDRISEYLKTQVAWPKTVLTIVDTLVVKMHVSAHLKAQLEFTELCVVVQRR